MKTRSKSSLKRSTSTIKRTYCITDEVVFEYYEFILALQSAKWWKAQNSYKHTQLLLRYKNKFISGDSDEDIAKSYMMVLANKDFANIIDTDEEFRNLALSHLTDSIIVTQSPKKATDGYCDHCGAYTKVQYDHILPKSVVGDGFGGMYNHQQLCPRCNLMKSDTVMLSEVKKFLSIRARYESLSMVV